MKTTIMILLLTLCTSVTFGQGKFKTTNPIILYGKPNLEFGVQSRLNIGSYLGSAE